VLHLVVGTKGDDMGRGASEGTASHEARVDDELAQALRAVRAELSTLGGQRQQVIFRRDELVLAARRRGASLRDVAGLVGLSHQAVKLIEERAGEP
jgi:ribosomal protein L19E